MVITPVLLSLLITACGSLGSLNKNPVSVTDMAGRSVEIPRKINKVYSTGPTGTVFLYTLAPEKLAGWNHEPRDAEKAFTQEKYHELPALGTWRGVKYDGNVEELLKTKPDLIINMGDVDQKYIADTDAIQEQLGIPVLMVDGSIDNFAAAYRYLGGILGVKSRAEALAKYCEETLTQVAGKLEGILGDERVRVYYAEGLEGMETEAKGSLNSEILDLAGAVNVADPGLEKNVRRMEVSFEQLYIWDPEVIILSTDGEQKGRLYSTVMSDSLWGNISAVNNAQVYEIPVAPYDWINRPPSVNRIIGIKWLANLLYPEIYDVDIVEEVKEFFNLFYQHELTQEEIDIIFQRSLRG